MGILNGLFGVILMALIGLFIAALANPSHRHVLRHFGSDSSRKRISKVFVPVIAATFIAFGMTTPVQADVEPTKVTMPSPQETSAPKIETKTTSEQQEIAFKELKVEDATLAKGQLKLLQDGKAGSKMLTYRVTTTDGIETKKELTSEKVTLEPVDKKVAVGTYVAPAPKPRAAPAKPAPAPAPAPAAAAPRSNCDPNYTPCVPLVSYDLDCPDIGHSITVIGSDPHGFDRDRDGAGCESY